MNEYTSQPGVSKQYVYIMEQVGSPYCKIGLSGDPVRRLVQLQNKNPNRIALRYVLEPNAGYRAHALEADLHSLLAACRLDGEWFEIGARDALFSALSGLDIAENIERVIEYPLWMIDPKPPKSRRQRLLPRDIVPRVKIPSLPVEAGYILTFILSGFLALFMLAGVWTGQHTLTILEAMGYFGIVLASTAGLLACAIVPPRAKQP